jgi:hypothetical protein
MDSWCSWVRYSVAAYVGMLLAGTLMPSRLSASPGDETRFCSEAEPVTGEPAPTWQRPVAAGVRIIIPARPPHDGTDQSFVLTAHPGSASSRAGPPLR